MPVTVLSGPHIAAGQSLSSALNVAAGGVFRIIMPDTWTAANLSFQISYDGTYYYNVYGPDGVEVTVPVIPGGVIAFGDYLMYIQWVKFRSGTALSPVIQDEDHSFRVVLDSKSTLLMGDEASDVPAALTTRKRKTTKRKAKAAKVPLIEGRLIGAKRKPK